MFEIKKDSTNKGEKKMKDIYVYKLKDDDIYGMVMGVVKASSKKEAKEKLKIEYEKCISAELLDKIEIYNVDEWERGHYDGSGVVEIYYGD